MQALLGRVVRDRGVLFERETRVHLLGYIPADHGNVHSSMSVSFYPPVVGVGSTVRVHLSALQQCSAQILGCFDKIKGDRKVNGTLKQVGKQVENTVGNLPIHTCLVKGGV